MTKLQLFMRNHDTLYLEPNELSKLASEIAPFTFREAFGVYKTTTDRYTLDVEHSVRVTRSDDER